MEIQNLDFPFFYVISLSGYVDSIEQWGHNFMHTSYCLSKIWINISLSIYKQEIYHFVFQSEECIQGVVDVSTGGVIVTPSVSGVTVQQDVNKNEPAGSPKRLHVSNIPFRFRDVDLRAMFGVTKLPNELIIPIDDGFWFYFRNMVTFWM